MLLVLLGPVGHLGPLDTRPVSLGKGSQIFGAHVRIRPRQSELWTAKAIQPMHPLASIGV